MIGSQDDAADVKVFMAGKHIASGTMRDVYLYNGVIYKIHNSIDAHHWGSNILEMNEIERLESITLPPNVRIPKASLYNVDGEPVIAMQYIEGQPMAECWCDMTSEPHLPTCMPAKVAALVSPFIGDTGGENVIFDGTDYWLVDLET